MPNQIDLIVPGLFGPIPVLPEQLPPTPVLDRLLARAEPRPAMAGEPSRVILARFGLKTDRGSAPFALRADDPGWNGDGWWLHADPVHLRPDLDRLRLFDARHLGITPDEAASLVDAFNHHFADDGLWLHAPLPGRWYLRCETPPAIETHPLGAVAGRDLDGRLPTGMDAGRWTGLMNEAQMLFHQHPVNARRESDGRPGINGLWTWGGGRLAPVPAPTGLTAVRAEHPLARGLAQAAGVDLRPAAEPPLHPDGPELVIRDDLNLAVVDADASGWAQALAGLEAWLAALYPQLRSGAIAGLAIDGCDGTARHLDRAALRRIWRRPLPLARRLGQPAPT